MADPELEAMFKAGVHFGYSRSRRHPAMAPFIFGLRHNVEVFDLGKVREKLREITTVIEKFAGEGKVILFVGTKPAIRVVLEETARKIGQPFMSDRWIGGLLTNFSVIRKRMDYFEGLREEKRSGELEKYTKKEQLMRTKEIERLEHNFRGVVSLKKIPDALFVVDTKEEITAVREAKRIGIPIFGILNNDGDPRVANYIVPANDSARSSVSYLLERIRDAWEKGKKSSSLNA